MQTHWSPPGRRRYLAPLFVVMVLVIVIAVAVWSSWSRLPGHHHAQRQWAPASHQVPKVLVHTPRLLSLSKAGLSVPHIPVPLPPLTVISRINTTDSVIFVTIDDGVYKPADAAQYIIDRGLPVTAFLTTSAAAHDVPYFTRLQEAGTAIENHTIAHPHMTRLPYDQQKHEMCASSEQLKAWYGKRPKLFRPPYGEYDDHTKRAASACGIGYIVLWNAVMDKGVLHHQRPGGLAAGDIVLLHFRPELKQELELLSQAAQARGLRFAALEDYLPR